MITSWFSLFKSINVTPLYVNMTKFIVAIWANRFWAWFCFGMEETSPIKKLISFKHFFISAVIGGPLMAGGLAGYNLWRLGSRRKAIGIILSGFVLTLLLEFSVALFARFVLTPLHIGLSFSVKLIAVLCFQVLFAYFIFLFLKT